MKKVLTAASLVFVAGCSSEPQLDKPTRLLKESNSVSASYEMISTEAGHSYSFNSIVSGAAQKANVKYRLRIALNNSQQAQAFKAQGKNLYLYVSPNLKFNYTYNGKPNTKTELGRMGNLSRNRCENGYYAVLGPHNNYSITDIQSDTIDIRTKSSGLNGFGAYTRIVNDVKPSVFTILYSKPPVSQTDPCFYKG